MGTQETRQQAEEQNPQTQEVAENEQQPEDAVSVFDEITSEQDSKDSESGADEDQELDAAQSGDTDNGDGTSRDNQYGTDEQGQSSEQGNGSPGGNGLTGNESLEELRREKAKLEHADKANRGRVSALTKKLNETREQLKKLQSSQDLDDAPTPDEIRALEEDFPEAAKLARAYVSQVKREMAPVYDHLDSNIQSQQEQIQYQELDRVAQRHPDFQEVAASDHFQWWAQNSSPGIQAMYQSSTAEDAVALLDLYKQQFAQSEQPRGHATSSQPRSRKADLEAHAELPRKGASRASAEPDDPVAIFDQIT